MLEGTSQTVQRHRYQWSCDTKAETRHSKAGYLSAEGPRLHKDKVMLFLLVFWAKCRIWLYNEEVVAVHLAVSFICGTTCQHSLKRKIGDLY